MDTVCLNPLSPELCRRAMVSGKTGESLGLMVEISKHFGIRGFNVFHQTFIGISSVAEDDLVEYKVDHNMESKDDGDKSQDH
jgi:hypothetical protein